MVKVVFVCLGNICRSPMAEAVFRQLVQEAQLSDVIEIDSAATSSWEQGNPVHPGTVKRLAQEGITTQGMFSRQLNPNDYSADYLIGMDEQNIRNIQHFVKGHSQAEIHKLLYYAQRDQDIADPWYTNDFETTYQDVLQGCRGLLQHIQQQLAAE